MNLASGVVSNFAGKSTGTYADNIQRINAAVLPTGLASYNGNLIFGNYVGSTGINKACLLRIINNTTATAPFFGKSVVAGGIYTIAGDYSLGCLNNTNAIFNPSVPGTTEELYDIEDVVVAKDLSNNDILYFSIYDNHCIMKLDATGEMSVAVGTCNVVGGAANTTISAATLRYPKGLAVDPNHLTNIFIVDQTDQATQYIRYANFSGVTVDSGLFTQSVDSLKIKNILSVANTPYLNDVEVFNDQFCYSSGHSTNTNAGNHNVICKDRDLSDAAMESQRCGVPIGSLIKGGGPMGELDDGLSCSASFFANPWGLAFDSAGNLYIADRLNHIIRFVKRWW